MTKTIQFIPKPALSWNQPDRVTLITRDHPYGGYKSNDVTHQFTVSRAAFIRAVKTADFMEFLPVTKEVVIEKAVPTLLEVQALATAYSLLKDLNAENREVRRMRNVIWKQLIAAIQ